MAHKLQSVCKGEKPFVPCETPKNCLQKNGIVSHFKNLIFFVKKLR